MKYRFDMFSSVRSSLAEHCIRELFWKTADSKQVGDILASIEDMREKCYRGEVSKEDLATYRAEQKKLLPVFTFHATFKNGRRRNADAVPSGLSMYDIDHIPDPVGYYEMFVKDRIEELGIVLAHKTPSDEGLRLVFTIPQGMNLAEAQKWMSKQLGDANYDQSVKDLARCSFAVPRDYILYIDEEKLFSMDNSIDNGQLTINNEELEESKQLSIVNSQLSINNEESKENNQLSIVNSPLSIKGQKGKVLPNPGIETPGYASDSGMKFKGLSYSDIIAEWFRQMGGEPVEGERNDKLHRLAAHLRYITDNNEALLLQVMPRYGLSEEEMRRLIHSACAAEWKSMPIVLRGVLEKLNVQEGEEMIFPEMPKRLPPLIAHLLSCTPQEYWAAVAHSVFPSLATYLYKVKFRYIDNVEHEATMMCILMAPTGAGKSCIVEPINRILSDIRKRDKMNLERERIWKQEENAKGANKDKNQRPEGLIIQEIDADMTQPAFLTRMKEAEEHFLYTRMNEIELFDALKGGGNKSLQFQIMRLAFDITPFGQTRVGTQSVTERVPLRFNWNASTTIQKGRQYFSRVLIDGPISRINFCTIPEREIGADIPVYGTYDEAFDEKLRPYIENLKNARGTIECPEAFKLAKKLREECAEYARQTQDRVYENLSFRANVIAYLKACILYVANGCKWEKSIEAFIRWSLQYDLWCKMTFFGADIRREMKKDCIYVPKKKGPRSLLDSLPNEFTLQDVISLRQSQGMKAKGTKGLLNQWIHRGHVTVMTDDRYKKA